MDELDELLGIGDFSAECGLSPKMLRSYAAAGLLVPAAVDRSSGYRYYSTDQLHRARVIALLRHAGISVEAIASYFQDPTDARFDRWDREIAREAAGRRRALAEARAALALGAAPPPDRRTTATRGSSMALDTFAGVASHRGTGETNQDATLVGDGLFAVADGIGGLQDGEVASRLALDTLDAAFAAGRSASGLLSACREANDAVWRQATARGTDPTMGTTLAVVAMTSDAGMLVVHAGDSRAYRLRDGQLDQLTDDHTVVGDLIRAGKLTDDDATTHPHRHVLTRALGVGPTVELDHAGVSCRAGDLFVLCTDGLSKALADDRLRTVLAGAGGAQESADRMVAAAVGNGADDDATALVVTVR
ncbi:MAG TPA: protein phosphatase 2C domain-containing protein [Acidimicrobiales bacterium]|nr:protein phosphatase 2C domain-containing protein [Acidimicrobiales bacterium]